MLIHLLICLFIHFFMATVCSSDICGASTRGIQAVWRAWSVLYFSFYPSACPSALQIVRCWVGVRRWRIHYVSDQQVRRQGPSSLGFLPQLTFVCLSLFSPHGYLYFLPIILFFLQYYLQVLIYEILPNPVNGKNHCDYFSGNFKNQLQSDARSLITYYGMF